MSHQCIIILDILQSCCHSITAIWSHSFFRLNQIYSKSSHILRCSHYHLNIRFQCELVKVLNLEGQTLAITTMKSKSMFWTASSHNFLLSTSKMFTRWNPLTVYCFPLSWNTLSPFFFFSEVVSFSSSSGKKQDLLFVSYCLCGVWESEYKWNKYFLWIPLQLSNILFQINFLTCLYWTFQV